MSLHAAVGFDVDEDAVQRLIDMNEGCVTFNESSSDTSYRRYLPGPHTGSASGKYMDTARNDSGEMSRNEPLATVPPAVLSRTDCKGKPVTEGLCVTLGVWEGVCVVDALKLSVDSCD